MAKIKKIVKKKKIKQIYIYSLGIFLHVFIPRSHHLDHNTPVFLLIQTQEQTEVLENLKQELATSKQELQIVQGSLENSAQVSVACLSLPHLAIGNIPKKLI